MILIIEFIIFIANEFIIFINNNLQSPDLSKITDKISIIKIEID